MDDWDLEKYYWPKERVERWWGEDWDWDNLLTKPCPHLDFKTYAEYYGEAFSKTIRFDDPRPGKTGQISEWEYWHLDGKDRWLTEFAGKLWTPYHLPLYNPHTLELSPKHPDYKGSDAWTPEDRVALTYGLRERIKLGGWRGNAPLAGIVIPSYTDLSGINQAIFLDFSKTLIGDNIKFSQAAFGDYTKFSETTVSAGADFSRTTFGQYTDFSKSMFSDETTFSQSQFNGFSTFNEAIFEGNLYFREVRFKNSTTFRSTKFLGTVDFSESNFLVRTNFDTAIFSSSSNFEYTYFGKNTSFINTNIKSSTTFRNAEFNGIVEFQVVQDTSDKNEFRALDFTNVLFKEDVNFSNRLISDKTDFSGATFHGLAKFYDAELSEETYFTFEDAHWPIPPAPRGRIAKSLIKIRRYICGTREETSETTEPEASTERFKEYEKAFCRLKKLHQGHEARTAEHFFYKLELKARMRRSDIRWTEKLAAGAYGLFSDYGESIGLPLRWLLVSLGVSTATAYYAALPTPADFAPDNLGFAATAAWHNLVPGGFVKDVFSACHDEACRSYRYGEWSDHLLSRWGFWLYVVTGLFAACNLALWFLFGLALKRRFQIK